MAWIHNGRKYWYHNGKRYSRSIRRRKSYYYVANGVSRETDYQGYLEAKASGLKTHRGNGYRYDTVKTSSYVDPDIWNFGDSSKKEDKFLKTLEEEFPNKKIEKEVINNKFAFYNINLEDEKNKKTENIWDDFYDSSSSHVKNKKINSLDFDDIDFDEKFDKIEQDYFDSYYGL